MAWLSSVSLTAADHVTHTILNNLGNDIRAWGGDVSGSGYQLGGVELRALRAGVNEANPLAKLHVTAPASGSQATIILDGARTSNQNTLLFRNSYWSTAGDGYGMAHIRAIEVATGKGYLDFATADGSGATFGVPARRLRLLDTGWILASSSLTAAVAQLHVHGVGETGYGISDAGAKGGMIYAQSLDAAAAGGGAVLFGATQGYFAAIKGALTNGGGQSTGDLCISTRRSTGATSLTPTLYVLGNGRVAVGLNNPSTPFGVAGLPVHADQTAASGAGLVAGSFYRHSDGGLAVVY